MNKKNFKGIIYVSCWIVIWGTIGSLIDFPLLKANIYIEGSIWQLLTFVITFGLCTIAGIKISDKFI